MLYSINLERVAYRLKESDIPKVVGETFTFEPFVDVLLTYLPNDKIRHKFIKPYMKPGARCMVVESATQMTQHLARVRFEGQEDTDLVSPEYLVLKVATKQGEKLLKRLQEAVEEDCLETN